MANKRNSKNNMKQVYLIRRVVAVLIIILIIVGIFTRCSNKKKAEEEKANQNLNQTQFDNNQVTQPNIVNGITDDNNLNEEPTEPELGTEVDGQEEIPEVIASNLTNIQNEYKDHTNVEYKKDDNAFYFNFKGDTRTMVTDRDEDNIKEDFNTFWEEFKYDLIKTSETLAETVEPGFELHVVDPKDDRSTILLIKDGSTLFDSTEI